MSGRFKYEHSLVLGKMMPFHLGHKHLIDSAVAKSLKTYVFVCSLSSEPISGYDRVSWVRETYQGMSNVIVIHLADDTLPQYPEEHPNFYDIWYRAVYTNLPPDVKLEAVFTSESYGDAFAESLGCIHELVDIDRKTYPVSGTAVRNNFVKNWHLLPPATQRGLFKKVAFVGPESVGKTSVVNHISSLFGWAKMLEYGREYVAEYGMSFFNTDDVMGIAKGHMLRYKKLIEDPQSPILLLDTELITTATWSELLLNTVPIELTHMIKNENDIDLFILMTPDVEWIDDGTRVCKDIRNEHFKIIQLYLEEHTDAPVYVVSGSDHESRIAQCIEILKTEYKIDE